MIIYKVTNKQNGKIYIGQTVKSLWQRWAQHCAPSSGCTALHNAIKKYGSDSFMVEIIDRANSRNELDKKEMYYISFYDCIAPKGYNLSEGGNGCRGYKHNEETRTLLSKIRTGKKGTPHTDEWKRKASERQLGKKHPHKGHPLSERQKQILREYRLGKDNPKKYKALKCIETGEIFPSRKHAAEKIGVKPSAISNSIKRGNRCRGLHFEYVEKSA